MAIFTQEGQENNPNIGRGVIFSDTGNRSETSVMACIWHFNFSRFFKIFQLSISSCFPVVPRNIIGNCNDAALLKRLVETLGFQHMDLEVTGPRVSWIDKAKTTAIDSHCQ